MQEEVNQRTIALTVKAAKLTGRVLLAAIQKYLAHLKKQRVEGLTPTGKQSVKQLMGHGNSTNSIPLEDDTRLFDRVARKYGVDYAFHKVEPGKYQLFFKAGQADAITAAFAEYTMMKRQQRKGPPLFSPSLKSCVRPSGSEHPSGNEQGRRRMRKDSIKKYVLPNLPYLLVGWAMLKIGTAYRIAAGADFGAKLLGTLKTIGPAFADLAPGIHPFDWLVGLVGAVLFRLFIYQKVRKAKKYRRDEEYGSARWGTPEDIKPFTDPVFKNNVILTGTEQLTMNTRPKNPANARNLNCCIIGSSGSGKTRFWLTPQLLQVHSSYVVVDPKGLVFRGRRNPHKTKENLRVCSRWHYDRTSNENYRIVRAFKPR